MDRLTDVGRLGKYQELWKNKRLNFNAQTQLIPSMRHKCLWIIRFLLTGQILGHNHLDLPLLVSLICDMGGLPQRCPIKIILELQSDLCAITLFYTRNPLTSKRDHRSPPICNIVEWFLHMNSEQGDYEANLHAAYARFGARKRQGIQNGERRVLCW